MNEQTQTSAFEQKIQYFTQVFELDNLADLKKRGLTPEFHVEESKTNYVKGLKYWKVDIGTSGRYMVEVETGNIYGIKAYGKIHRGHQYGTLDTVDDYDWGPFYAKKRSQEGLAEMNDFEAKRQAKADRFKELAEKNNHISEQRHKAAGDISGAIPFGQPILCGHHSESRHRRAIERIDQNMRKSIEASDKAKYYKGRAATIENSTTIFSDDPEAGQKLEQKIADLEKSQQMMIVANKLVRKNDRQGLLALGLTEAQVDKLLTPDYCGRIGFAGYQLTNNNANIRRLKQRLNRLSAQKSVETTEKEVGGVRIVDSQEDNRLQIFFPTIPAPELRQYLKSNGFRWSPSNGCWQAFRGNAARYHAEELLKMIS